MSIFFGSLSNFQGLNVQKSLEKIQPKKQVFNLAGAEITIIEDNSIPDGEIHSYPPYQKFKFKKDE